MNWIETTCIIRAPRRLGVVLLLCALSAAVQAGIGDYWTAAQQRVPVYAGPDRGFDIRIHIGVEDVVRQESNTKIRGFIKVLVPGRNHVTGYVLERQLTLLDSGAAAAGDRPAAPDTGRLPAAPAPTGERSGGFWPLAGLVLIALAAVAGAAWYLLARRGMGAGAAAGGKPVLRAVQARFPRLAGLFRRGTALLRPLRSWLDARTTRAQAATGSADYAFYAAVAEELEAGTVDRALWTRALAMSGGDADKQRAIYVGLRVTDLKGR